MLPKYLCQYLRFARKLAAQFGAEIASQAGLGQTDPLDLIHLDQSRGEPLYRQLYDQLRDLILAGDIGEGSRLPSTRTISKELAISRNTVVSALDQLAAEGLIVSRRGAGSRVARVATSRGRPAGSSDANSMPDLSPRGELMTAQPRVRTIPSQMAFHPGSPELDSFPFKAWGRLLARRSRPGGQDLFGYHHILGHPDLRRMIASFLSTMRRVRCTPDQIVVTTGGQAALDLLARLLLADGDTVWMEEPGYIGARSAFLAAGARLESLPVTLQGWQVPGASVRSPRLIYLTPSCHYPLGITMPVEQRLSVLEVANAENAWIIEDDYDGEYTFRGQPLPAMQGLADQSWVIYVGTFAKTLFPAKRLGFMVLPQDLASRIKPALNTTGQFVPLLLQATLADFIEQGLFFLHLTRMRRLYSRRCARFLELLSTHLGDWLDPIDGATGIQIAAILKQPLDDEKLAEKAGDQGINLAPLSLFFLRQPRYRGLLMGYAGVQEATMERLLPVLRGVIEDMS